MNLYDATVPVFTKFLGNIASWLDKAEAHAAARKYDPAVLVQARLAPDQWPLGRQITGACDGAKWAAAKLAGKPAPSFPDDEKTVAELRARIRATTDFLATLGHADFVGALERPCQHQWMQGKQMRGGEYLDHFALPNFYFHVAHAYAILRHNGVELTKPDYLGDVPFTA